MYKHILVPTDGSQLATKGLDQGLALAKTLGASVTIVTVTELWSPYELAIEARSGKHNPVGQFEQEAAETARRVLDAAAARAEAAGVDHVTLHIPDMPPAEGIIQAATDRGCDLIVMSSHGRRGVRRFILGSQTAEVVSHTTIPVLVIR